MLAQAGPPAHRLLAGPVEALRRWRRRDGRV